MLEEKLSQDLKAAMLAGDKQQVTVLRSLKSAILYAKIASNSARDEAMPDEALLSVLQKEAKKRQESADLYQQGGSEEKAAIELYEKSVIEKYLPVQLDEVAVAKLVDEAIASLGEPTQAAMGQIITQVRKLSAGAADGALIARVVKERLAQ